MGLFTNRGVNNRTYRTILSMHLPNHFNINMMIDIERDAYVSIPK